MIIYDVGVELYTYIATVYRVKLRTEMSKISGIIIM